VELTARGAELTVVFEDDTCAGFADETAAGTELFAVVSVFAAAEEDTVLVVA
jgi:hypothetical protein